MGYLKKYKMADKLKALELLGRHTGAFDRAEKRDNGVLLELIQGLRDD